jgi:hypothetical protein
VDIGAGVPQKRSEMTLLISAEQIMRIVGNSTERLSGDIKEVRKASKEACRASCSSINDIPRSAKLHRDPKIRLGFLVAPSGRLAQSKRETCIVIEKEAAPAAVRQAKSLDWRVAARVVTYGRVVWAIDSFIPYSPGIDGIFPAVTSGTGIFVRAWRLATFQPYGARLR